MKTTKMMLTIFTASALFIIATQYAAQKLAAHTSKAPDYRAVCEQLVNEQIMSGYPADRNICR